MMLNYKETPEPMSNVEFYFKIDDYNVGVLKEGESTWRQKKIYHESENGILCDDFETYIDFNHAKQPEILEDENC